MKHYSIYLLLFIFSFDAISQKKEVTFPIQKKQDIYSVSTLGFDEGFVVLISEKNASNHHLNTNLRYFSKDLEEKWNVQLKYSSDEINDQTIVCSAFSNYMYVLGNSVFINRISSEGEKSNFKATFPKEYKNVNLIAKYVDETGLNYITYKGEDKSTNKEFIIFRLQHDKKSFEMISLNLGLINENSKDYESLDFLGHDEENIFLSHKSIDFTKNTINYLVYSISKSDFESISTNEFSVQITNELVPCMNTRTEDGSVIYNNDYSTATITKTTISNGISRSYTYTIYNPKAGAYGCSRLDIENGFFYIYGVTTAKKFTPPKLNKKTNKPETSEPKNEVAGAYVVTYDFNKGELIKKEEFSLPKNAASDFPKKMNMETRSIWFDVFNDKITRISISPATLISKDAIVYCTTIGATAKPESIRLTYPSKVDGGWTHRRLVSNLALPKSIVPNDVISFSSNPKEIRSKEYSKFGILLKNRIILVKNHSFTKTPKIEFWNYDLLNK